MLETRVIVMQTEPGVAWVQAVQGGSCDACQGKGCSSSKLGQLFCSKPRQFEVDNPIAAQVGEEVLVGVAEGTVLYGIAMLYVLPLALLLLGGGIGQFWLGSDGAAALGALLGAGSGFVLARWVARRRRGQATACILRRV